MMLILTPMAANNMKLCPHIVFCTAVSYSNPGFVFVVLWSLPCPFLQVSPLSRQREGFTSEPGVAPEMTRQSLRPMVTACNSSSIFLPGHFLCFCAFLLSQSFRMLFPAQVGPVFLGWRIHMAGKNSLT